VKIATKCRNQRGNHVFFALDASGGSTILRLRVFPDLASTTAPGQPWPMLRVPHPKKAPRSWRLSLAAALFALALPMGAPTLAQTLQLTEERETSVSTSAYTAMIEEARLVRSRAACCNPLVFTPPLVACIAPKPPSGLFPSAGHRLPCGLLAPLRC
jgi:hypothetical protein